MSLSWRERTVAARARGRFTETEASHAALWPTCAVGEQHAALPTVVVYKRSLLAGIDYPVDHRLRALGSNLENGFSVAVRHNDFNRVDDLLDLIEDRVLQLKREAPEAQP